MVHLAVFSYQKYDIIENSMNTEFFKADIFFVITSVAVVIIAGGLAVAFFYVIKILRDVKDISQDVRSLSSRAKVEGEHLVDDFATMRLNLKGKGIFAGAGALARGILARRKKGRRTKK